MDTLAEIESDPVEPVQRKMNEIQSVTDRSEDTTSVSGLTEINVKNDSPSIDKSCSPQTPMDSHSDAEGSAALSKQTTKRNLVAEDGKQGVRAVGERKSFKCFMYDLQQVVLKEKCTAEHQYILEAENRDGIFAAYLFWDFGEVTEAQSTVSHKMADNCEVMKHWARATGKGFTRETTEGYLRTVWEQI